MTDSSSPKLLLACAAGTHIGKATKNTQEAWTFLKWFSSTEAATIWTKVIRRPP